MVKFFEPKMYGLPLYLRNAAPTTPIKRGSNGPTYEMCKKRQKKGEVKRERKEEKMRDLIAKTNKKKQKQKKKPKQKTSPCAYISHRDPCAMTFRECKNLAVLDCEE